MALIVTLSLIVLVTVAAMAFFTRATSNTAVEASRSKQVLADQLLLTARDYLHGVFLQEITANSSSTGGLYAPLASTNMVPRCLVSSAASNAAFTNLVRQSVSAADSNASTDNTATAAKNGHYLSANLWNASRLTIPTNSFTANQTPCWIYLNKNGSTASTPSANTVGRFAYNVYDVGGLLDANVAGRCSGSFSTPQLESLRGTLAAADLTQIGGITVAAMNNMAAYRNPQAAISVTAYTNYVLAAVTNGFLSPAAGTYTNNFFNSRQDLINYVLYYNTNRSLDANLPYLTHFTRELARPSLTNNGITNMTSRCDLSQLTNTSITNSSPLTNFGLSGASSYYFTYTNLLSATITNANPDMFQVLRAGILYTNSWESNGPSGVFDPASSTWATNMDLKALAIGANILMKFREQINAASARPIRITNSILGTTCILGDKMGSRVSRVFLVCNNTVTITTNVVSGVTNTITNNNITFSVIPQVYNMDPFNSDNLSNKWVLGTLGSGTLTLSGTDFTTNLTIAPVPASNPTQSSTNQNISVTPTNVAACFVTNTATVASNGFFCTTLTTTNSLTNTTLRVSLTGLSFAWCGVLSNNPILSVFSTNSDSANSQYLNSPVLSASVSFSATLSTNGSTISTNPKNIDGIAILTVDPRTLFGAGATTNFQSYTIGNLSNNIVPVTTNYFPSTLVDTYSDNYLSNFPSVGYLGYVFRQSPWRTIDFASGPSSADRNLLDLFSAFPTPTRGIRAGVINLNTRQPLVLKALLAGTVTTISSKATSTISSSIAGTYASNMVSFTSTNPLTNRSQLVDLVSNNTIATSTDTSKVIREAAVRALAEVGQTRTWNLMYDLVVQAGRFSGSPYTAANFIVDSEKHCWVHVAIDRPTAKVIDQQIEIVNP